MTGPVLRSGRGADLLPSPVAGLVLRSGWGGLDWYQSGGNSGCEVWVGGAGLVQSPVAGPVLRSGQGAWTGTKSGGRSSSEVWVGGLDWYQSSGKSGCEVWVGGGLVWYQVQWQVQF